MTSCLLVLVLFNSTLGCVTGSAGKATNPCSRSKVDQIGNKAKHGMGIAGRAVCGDCFDSQSDPCRLRGLLQSQLAVLPYFKMPAPSPRAAGQVRLPSPSISIASSIGSPQTDRGPPDC